LRTILPTMRRIQRSLQAIIAAVLLAGLPVSQSGTVRAEPANNPSLIISQLKITSKDGQFITLYNATDSALDMGKYRLEYFNSYDLGQATSVRLITLSGTVPPHGYFMINDDALLLCYRLTVDSVSLGLSSTAGRVEVLDFGGSGSGSSAPVLQDYAGWSKKDVDGAQTLPEDTDAFLQRAPTDANDNPLVTAPGDGSWQSVKPDSTNPCELVGVGSANDDTGSVPTGLSQLLPSTEPPVTIVGAISEGQPTAPPPMLPAADIGLMAPTVTELLPNPAGTGNDSADEFIELYNPNAKAFDLSGFSLQTGMASLHTFKFASGTSLPAKGFKAFYSAETGLSLSNGGGQAKLLDPFGNSISATAVYGTAKDGTAWALGKGKWYWTTMPTPSKANIIKEPPSKVSKKASSKASSKKSPKTSGGKVRTTNTASASTASDQAADNPIHVRTLVLVAGLALLYALYEYRSDLANRIYRFRQNFGARYEDRQ
jgi:lamin tail-like protein